MPMPPKKTAPHCSEKSCGEEHSPVRTGYRDGQPPSREAYLKWMRAALKTLRHSCRYTQRDLAALLGVSRSTYTYYETGHTLPGVDVLAVLARLYNVPLEIFFTPLPPVPAKRPARRTLPELPAELGKLDAKERQLVALSRMGAEKGLLEQLLQTARQVLGEELREKGFSALSEQISQYGENQSEKQ